MRTKGIFTKALKFVSASIGELIVGGLILGSTYFKGYFDAMNEKKKSEDKDKKETEEPVAEAEATESTTGETAPPIEVSSNQSED